MYSYLKNVHIILCYFKKSKKWNSTGREKSCAFYKNTIMYDQMCQNVLYVESHFGDFSLLTDLPYFGSNQDIT